LTTDRIVGIRRAVIKGLMTPFVMCTAAETPDAIQWAGQPR